MAAPTQQEFEHIVRNCMSGDNNIRKQAEEMYTGIKNGNPSWLVQALLHLLTTSDDQALRQMSAVVFRRAISKGKEGSLFAVLPAELQAQTKQQLLALLAKEEVKAVRRSLSHCVASLGSGLVEKGEWNELFPFLFNGVAEGSAEVKKSALSIFSQLVVYVADDFLIPYLPTLKDAFAYAMSEQQPLQVRIGAVEAVSALVQVLEDAKHVSNFQPLNSTILSAIGQSLTENNNDLAMEGLEAIINVAESTPHMFSKVLPDVFSAMLQIASTDSVEEEVRHMAIEFCLTVCDADARHAKKVPQFVEGVFPLLFRWMAGVEDSDEWKNDEEDENEEITSYEVGLEALDRLALSLGGKIIEPVATTLIAQHLNSGDWQQRHTGLMALSQIAEGCAKQFETNLGAIVHMVLKHLQDPNVRVRWAAVNCVAQLCNDFSPGLQATFHSAVIPALLNMLGDSTPKVVAHTANAFVNFMDEADAQFVAPYLDALVTKLLMVLQASQSRKVQEEVLAAFASIAQSCEEAFVKYYDAIVPYLKTILANQAHDKGGKMLRAKAMECISLIGMSVGNEKFSKDAKEIMECLHATHQSKLSPDDPQAQYILQAWARIAKCLGDDFAPYLPHVVPSLLEQASLQTDVTVTDVVEGEDEPDEEEGVETLTLAIKGAGDKRIQIKTSLLQDKALACSVIESYLEDCPQGMSQYVETLSQIMIPLLKFPYLGEIRDSASNCLPHMLKCLPPNLTKPDMLRHYMANLIEAIKAESDVEVACSLVTSMRNCVLACDKNAMPDDAVLQVANILKHVFDESFRRRKNVTNQQTAEDDEDELEKLEAENEGEEELLNQVVEAVGAMVKTHSTFIPPFMNVFYPMCMELVGDKYGNVEHRLAICVLDDFIEHGSQLNAQATHLYAGQVCQVLLKYANADDPDVAQAACYGLGVCAQWAPVAFKEVLPDAVGKLVAVVKNPAAAEEMYSAATANAVSSIVKIITGHGDHDSGLGRMEHLLPLVLPTLPIQGDEIEARFIHGQLVDWVLANNPIVLGKGGSNMGAIKELCKNLVGTDLVDEVTKQKIETVILK